MGLFDFLKTKKPKESNSDLVVDKDRTKINIGKPNFKVDFSLD